MVRSLARTTANERTTNDYHESSDDESPPHSPPHTNSNYSSDTNASSSDDEEECDRAAVIDFMTARGELPKYLYVCVKKCKVRVDQMRLQQLADEQNKLAVDEDRSRSRSRPATAIRSKSA